MLLKGCDLAMDFTKVVQVCCVLHNLCEEAGDMFFEHWSVVDSLNEQRTGIDVYFSFINPLDQVRNGADV